MKKRLISFLLTIAMVLTLVPAVAFAANEKQFQLSVVPESGSLTALKVGDTVKVVVKSPSTAISAFHLIDVGISFDKDRFELTAAYESENDSAIKECYKTAFPKDKKASSYSETTTEIDAANTNGKFNIVTTNAQKKDII